MSPHPTRSLANSIAIGPQTQHLGVRAPGFSAPTWLANYACCPLLEHYQIIHLGAVCADPTYSVTRVNSPFSHFIACLEGEAELWSDNGVHRLAPGSCCLLPKGSTYMDQTAGKKPWKFCYVCYVTPGKQPGFHGLYAPQVDGYDAKPFMQLIETLEHECAVHHDLECQRQILGVIHHMVMRFTQLHAPDQRLSQLWQRVSAAPAEDWSLERMEQEAHLHREQLRRLCQRHFGRSPVRHVAFLRMERAADLLNRTCWTIEHIASEVGYADPFSFSAAFKQWYQLSPAHYRQRTSRCAPCAATLC